MGLGRHWEQEAVCRIADSELMFAELGGQRHAKVLCARCSVSVECLAEALDNRIEFGVWGGMTPNERGALLRRRPGVVSWHEALTQARRERALKSMLAAG